MTTETIVAPDVATQNQASEAVEGLEVASPEVETSQESPETPAKPDEATEADKALRRLQRRIDRVTASRYQEAARADELQRRLVELERAAGTQSAQEAQDVAPIRAEDIERIATQRAQEIAKVQTVAARSNQVFQEGVKAFGETFREHVAAVTEEVGALIDPRGLPTALGEAILDSDAPAQLIAHLAQNPDTAESLQGLTPAQLGRRIARIEAALQAPAPAVTQKASAAPRPLSPVRASAAPSAPDIKDTAAYIKWANAQDAAKRRTR